MSLTAVILIVVLVLLGAYAVSLYNGMVRLKHGVSKAWQHSADRDTDCGHRWCRVGPGLVQRWNGDGRRFVRRLGRLRQ